MILKKDQKEDIAQRLDFLRIQINDLAKFSNLDWETYKIDRDMQRNIERLAENAANAAIDVCKILLVVEEIEMPNSYKEIILKLGNILDEGLVKKIAEYAALRNILAHQYLDLRWDKIKKFISNGYADFETFINKVTERIRKC